MNKFLNGMKDATNFAVTENGALTHKTTKSDLLDMFALGGSMRNRNDSDIILMFQKAFKENPVYAIKCLFYLRDILEGAGERRFFRVAAAALAKSDPAAMRRNLAFVPMLGRWDDLYAFVGTPVEADALGIIKHQLTLDVQSKTPSLLGKWLKSENTSSSESRRLANITRQFLGMNHKQYRKTLSTLRERINVLERLMSAGKWDEIEFDKIPSQAGIKYRNAFARHDVERMKIGVLSYKEFAQDETKTVNAKALAPYECVSKALRLGWKQRDDLKDTERLMINKYWDNLTDYFNGAEFNGMAIVDTSGSMSGTPMDVAISLGMYCAEKGGGPFKNHFITFESNPHFIEVEGVDFVDKVVRISKADWNGSTNIEAAFNLMLDMAIRNKCSQEDIPQNLIVISDMEFDSCITAGPVKNDDRYWFSSSNYLKREDQTVFETIEKRWNAAGYKMPKIVFWNVDARQNNIPMLENGYVSYISGFSVTIFEALMSGKTGYDLMMEKLNSPRYADIK